MLPNYPKRKWSAQAEKAYVSNVKRGDPHGDNQRRVDKLKEAQLIHRQNKEREKEEWEVQLNLSGGGGERIPDAAPAAAAAPVVTKAAVLHRPPVIRNKVDAQTKREADELNRIHAAIGMGLKYNELQHPESEEEEEEEEAHAKKRIKPSVPSDSYASSEVWDLIIDDAEQLQSLCEDETEMIRKVMAGRSYEERLRTRLQSDQAFVPGDIILRQYINNFKYFKTMKFGPQMQVKRAAMGALIPQIFGADFEPNRERISRMYKIYDFRKEVLVTMPRRCGKSLVAAQIEANCLYTFGGKSAVFAAYFFQSSEFKNMVYEFLCQMPGGKESIVINNQKKLVIQRDTVIGQMYIFAGKVNSARGFTAKRIYYDEASFADPNFITSNVFAGMLLANTFVFLISSPPDDSNNVFNQMCHAKNVRGEPIFKWIRIESMCADCQRKKLTKCSHVTIAIPPWHAGSEERATIEAVLGVIDPRRYRIEILGVAEGVDVAAFPLENITEFSKRQMVRFKGKQGPKFIGIAIDPSGEGESETGICAIAKDEAGRVVVSTAAAATEEFMSDCFALRIQQLFRTDRSA